MDVNIWKHIIIWTADERSNRRKILAVTTQLKQLRKESLKKIQAFFIYLHPFIHPSRVYYELTIWPVGLIARLVEHCTGIAEVMGSNPVQAWIFFRLSFRNCLSCVVTARIFLLFDLSSAVQIYVFIYLHPFKLQTNWHRTLKKYITLDKLCLY